MQHDVIYASPAARRIIRTRDAACSCAPRCATRDDTNAAGIIVLALRHLENLLAAVEQRWRSGEGQLSPDRDQRLAEARQRQVDMVKEKKLQSIEEKLAQHEADKREGQLDETPERPLSFAPATSALHGSCFHEGSFRCSSLTSFTCRRRRALYLPRGGLWQGAGA